METKVLQIESLAASELIARLDKMESAITALGEKQSISSPKEETEYITRSEVSKMLKISIVTVSDWTSKGILTGYKCGKRVYFKRAELESALVKKGGLYARR